MKFIIKQVSMSYEAFVYVTEFIFNHKQVATTELVQELVYEFNQLQQCGVQVMNTFNSYTANNSTVNDGVHDMVTNTEQHSFFKCTQCRWEEQQLVMCPKCAKFDEQWSEINDIPDQVECVNEPIDGGSNWELLGCLIYVFGIIAAFGLLIWSTL